PPASALHTLSLHDALPISADLPNQPPPSLVSYRPNARPAYFASTPRKSCAPGACDSRGCTRDFDYLPGPSLVIARAFFRPLGYRDRKSTRLNSSHVKISYA